MEAWLEDHAYGLPEMLVESARALADRVDDDPSNSPIWGRFQHGLDQLFDAYLAEDARASQEVEEALAQVRHAGDVETYRAAKYRQAEEAGDEAGMRKYGGRLVPEACGHGNHRWHRWPAGRTTCTDCGELDIAASSPESLPPHLRA